MKDNIQWCELKCQQITKSTEEETTVMSIKYQKVIKSTEGDISTKFVEMISNNDTY